MYKFVLNVTVSRTDGTTHGYESYHIPYTSNVEESVDIYARMVEDLCKHYVLDRYSVRVGWTRTWMSFEEYAKTFDVKIMDLGELIDLLPQVRLKVTKTVTDIKYSVKDVDKMVSVHMGHVDVSFNYSKSYDHTFVNIKVPREKKWNSSYMREFYREGMMGKLFPDREFKTACNGTPYLRGKFRITYDFYVKQPITVVFQECKETVEEKYEREIEVEL